MHWGIDLGGTKVEGVVFAADQQDTGLLPDPLCRIRIPSKADESYESMLGQIDKLVSQMSDESGFQPESIGVGTPGVLDTKTELIKNSNSQSINHQPLQRDLEKLLKIPVKLANDANCFALAEARFGAGRGAESVFGVIMGTGVGGGIVIDGRILTGNQGIAGEWGHISIKADGEDCYCGQKGCVETLISGPALEKFYESQSGKKKKLVDIVIEKDEAAKATQDRLSEYFGLGLSHVVNILDPEVIVLGGGVSNVELLYDRGVATLNDHIFNLKPTTRVIKNQLGDSAGVFGAALL